VGHALSVVMSPAGLYLPALDLHLDPSIGVQAAYVSHAHGARVGGLTSGTLLASPETLGLLEMRSAGAPPASHALGWNASIERPLSAGFGGGTARLSLAPAGHLLGAAQLVIDHPGGRFVYTGDYQSGPGLTHAAGAPVPCDELVIESTYALPIFRFPDRVRVRLALVAWCRARLEEGNAPVVIATPLGKSQEIVRALVDAELNVLAHEAVYRACETYESLGVPLGLAEKKVAPYVKKKGRAVSVVIAPPTAYADAMIKKLPNARVAYVSGRALLDAPLEQMRADIGFPLSDHADHDDLVATVRASGARQVVTTFGDAASFAVLLTERGFEATAIAASSLDETT
jgi:Cft2 family RNA processing exonuclease